MTEAQKKKTLGLAIASMVLSFLFIIPLLGFLFSLAAIILGIVALVKISNSKETLCGNGMAITGITVGAIGIFIIPIFALLAAIAIPNLLRARLSANEALAMATLRSINAAAQTYETVNHHYPENFSVLTYADPPYLAKDYSLEVTSGYKYQIPATLDQNTFFATAVPEKKGTSGSRSFCVDDQGVLRGDPDGDEIYTYQRCTMLDPAQVRVPSRSR